MEQAERNKSALPEGLVCPICRGRKFTLNENDISEDGKPTYTCCTCRNRITVSKPKLDRATLRDIFAEHAKWLDSHGKEGKCAALAEWDIRGISFADMDLSFLDFSYCDLTGCNFRNASCFHTNFKHTVCRNTDFSHASLRGASIAQADFSAAVMKEVNLSNTSIRGCKFLKAELSEGNFIGASFTECDLSFASSVASSFNEAQFKDCTFTQADLRYSILTKSEFSRCNLNMAHLDCVQAFRVSIHNSTLKGAFAPDVNFTEAVIRATDIDGLNLLSATLVRSQMDDAILQFGGYGTNREVISFNLTRNQISSPWSKSPVKLQQFAAVAKEKSDAVFMALSQTFAVALQNYQEQKMRPDKKRNDAERV